MDLNREKIIKALECCTSPDGDDTCLLCPYGDINLCTQSLMAHALSLIEALTEENERLKERLGREAKCQYDLCGQIVDLKAIAEQYRKQFEEAKADTVREFVERLKQYIDVGHYRPPTEICFSELDVANIIDKIKKEMLEGAK